MNWYYHTHIGIDIVKFWKNMAKILIWPAMLCGCVLSLGKVINFYNLYNLITGISLFAAMYFAISWRVVMNEYEKGLVRGLFFRLKA